MHWSFNEMMTIKLLLTVLTCIRIISQLSIPSLSEIIYIDFSTLLDRKPRRESHNSLRHRNHSFVSTMALPTFLPIEFQSASTLPSLPGEDFTREIHTATTKTCLVCGGEARCANYGAYTCKACRAFFRRHGLRPKVSNMGVEMFDRCNLSCA